MHLEQGSSVLVDMLAVAVSELLWLLGADVTGDTAVEDGEAGMVPFAKAVNGADADDVSMTCLYSRKTPTGGYPLGQCRCWQSNEE